MRLLLVSMNFAPEWTGIGKYSGEMADALVDAGHEVAVVCAPPHYPHWCVADGYAAGRYAIEHPRRGLTVYRCPVWVPRRASAMRRLIYLASFAVACLPVLLRLALWRPAVVMSVVPSLLSAPVGWLAGRLAGARCWLHVQDLEMDTAFELGLLRGSLLRRMLAGVEGLLMRRFDVVSTIAPRMLRALVRKGVRIDRAALLPNWVQLDEIRPLPPDGAVRRALDIRDDQIVCLHAGTMNLKQGLHLLVESARALQHRDDIVFLLCGNGQARAPLEAAAHGLANLRFIDLQPAGELNALLAMADIHLLPQLRGAADLVMPSKLAGMLASGRVVLAATPRGSEIARTLDDCGVVVEPESVPALAAAIEALADDPERRCRLGAAARRYAEHTLGREAILHELDARLRRLAETGSSAVADDWTADGLVADPFIGPGSAR